MLTNLTLFSVLIENHQDLTGVTSVRSQSYQRAYRMLQLCKTLPISDPTEKLISQ